MHDDLQIPGFLVGATIGSGGMGTVYRARDERSGEVVAVKVLRPGGPWDAERFRREAEVLAGVSHPAIVRYVAHGTTAGGQSYLVMEWLEGETLSRRLGQAGIDVAGALAVGVRVGDALGALHRLGMVHRDVKPGNVMLAGGRLDRAMLLDFGIVRRLGAGEALTATGAILGTPGYMAPEQLRGQRDLDARADVFALGCLLFKCLTGRAPFEGDDPLAVMMAVALEPAPRVGDLQPDAPPELDALVAAMLAKAPAERPRDGAEVARALAAIEPPAQSLPRVAAAAMPALTSTEQLVTCLVLAGRRGEARAAEATLADAARHGLDRAVAAIAGAHGGELWAIGDGLIALSVTGGGELSDLALRAGRAALALRAILPDVPLAVVAGRTRGGGTSRAGQVLERGLALLGGEGPSAIRLDASAATLLTDRLDVVAGDDGAILRGELGVAEGQRRLLGKTTRCVGRDREIDTLLGLYREAAGEPVARAVLVTGAAGVGKSRLRYEILQAIAREEGSPEIWLGRGDPMSAGSPFGMIGELVRAAAGLDAAAAPEIRREQLRARVARHVAAAEIDRVTTFLGELTGAPAASGDDAAARAARQSPALMGDQIRRAFEDFVAAECAHHPVVIVLEDLHWGDLSTVKCVDGALRALADAPLFVLALGRREVRELYPRLWEERRMQELHLGELTPKAAARLVREVLGPELPEAEVQALLRRAGGNAFYLEELIRAAAEGKGGDLPDTILAMLEARLSRLDPEARRALRAGAVFGQVFWRSGVTALLGGPDRAPLLDTRLSFLIEQELVTARPTSRFPGEPEYTFRHALLRDAAYATLTDDDLALGHRLAGAWLESAGETQAVTLAEHFERGRDPERAVGWYRRAAEQALEGGDLEGAIARAERGLGSSATGEDRGALQSALGVAHLARGENAEAERHGAAALGSLAAGSAPWFAVAGDVATARGRLLRRERLLELGRTIEGARPIDEQARGPRLTALAGASVQLIHLGEDGEAGALIGRLGGEAASLGEADGAAAGWVLRARGTWASHQGDLGAFLDLIQLAVAAFDRAGDVRSACLQRVNVGYALLELGAFAEAEPVLRQALAAAERLGAHNAAGMARNNLGLVLARRGALDEGIAVERAAVEAFERFGDRRMESGSRTYLGLMLLEKGELAAAEEEARTSARLVDTPAPLAYALGVLAQVLLAARRTAEALVAARAAMTELGRAGGFIEGAQAIRLVQVEALAQAGAMDEARKALAEARWALSERAARIERAEHREAFLANVPENARTFALVL